MLTPISMVVAEQANPVSRENAWKSTTGYVCVLKPESITASWNSPRDIVNTINAPESIPGSKLGISILVFFYIKEAPRLSAASSNSFQSISFKFACIGSIINGNVNIKWEKRTNCHVPVRCIHSWL